jgi:hypothetical protein
MKDYIHRVKNLLPVIVLFLVAFIFGPLKQLDLLSLMPGDLGDARLNNYFLENIYQFILGRSPSLIHLGFFYPFTYVGGYSDNLFGSSPVYLLARAISGEPDTAFQLWYLMGYLINYFAAYYALRKLEISRDASIAGALLFAFALPVTGQSEHAQLHYRFAVPLSLVLFIQFLATKNWLNLIKAIGWLVWQFYCSIYIGFFLLLSLSTMSCLYVMQFYPKEKRNSKPSSFNFCLQWKQWSQLTRWKFASAVVFIGLSMVVLFYPYIQVTLLYGAKRTFQEISPMLPRLQSYFFSDEAWLWKLTSSWFGGLPLPWEHRLWIGVVPMALTVFGLKAGIGRKYSLTFSLMAGSLVTMIVLTLFLGSFSPWRFLSWLPLASAIRAMARIILVLLFPVAFLCAFAIDQFKNKNTQIINFLPVVLILLMIVEFSATSPSVSSKSEWRARLTNLEATLPADLPKNSAVFFAQMNGPFYADELDAMWVALKRGLPTLNGYSGMWPPGYSKEYGSECNEPARRVQAYVDFARSRHILVDEAVSLRSLVLIGFKKCSLNLSFQ